MIIYLLTQRRKGRIVLMLIDFILGLTIAKRALLGHYCHIFTFVVGLEQCKNMGRQPNYEPFIVPVAAIPVEEGIRKKYQ
jgi:hypothetical protein